MDASVPTVAVTQPPSAAPSASITDHVPPERAFAVPSSSSVTSCGMAALRAGKKTPVIATMRTWQVYSAKRLSARWATMSPIASTARTTSEATSSVLRFNRSTSGPAIGETRNTGSVLPTRIPATASPLPDSSCTIE